MNLLLDEIARATARLAEAGPARMEGGAHDWPGAPIRKVPHILKDGADSVGPAGAMMRVYVNEGLYSQLSLSAHDLLLGLRPQKPFPVGVAFRNSVYWRATYARTANIASFFARLGPMRLADAPGGPRRVSRSSRKDVGPRIRGSLQGSRPRHRRVLPSRPRLRDAVQGRLSGAESILRD